MDVKLCDADDCELRAIISVTIINGKWQIDVCGLSHLKSEYKTITGTSLR